MNRKIVWIPILFLLSMLLACAAVFMACESGDDAEQVRTWGGGDTEEDDDDLSNSEGDDDSAADDDDDATDDDDDDDATDDDDDIGNHLVFKFVTIDAGDFLMGSPVDEENGEADVEIQHKVILTNSFQIMDKEVSFGQWKEIWTYSNASANKCNDDKCPMAKLTIWEAMAFANKLSVKDGYDPCYNLDDMACFNSGSGDDGEYCEDADGIQDVNNFSLNGVDTPYECEGYRLPTEAEWEFAARAGTDTYYYNGDVLHWPANCDVLDDNLDKIAFYSCNSSDQYVQYVNSSKEPNAKGLYHMLGNVREWVYDEYGDYPEGEVTNPVNEPSNTSADWRITRGGSVNQTANQVRCARRQEYPGNHTGEDNNRSVDIGFRLVRTLD